MRVEQEKQPERGKKEEDDEEGGRGREQVWDTLIRGNRQHICYHYPATSWGLIEEKDQEKNGTVCLIWNQPLFKDGRPEGTRDKQSKKKREDMWSTLWLIGTCGFSLLSSSRRICNDNIKYWRIDGRRMRARAAESHQLDRQKSKAWKMWQWIARTTIYTVT